MSALKSDRVRQLQERILQDEAELVELLAGEAAPPSNDVPPFLTMEGYALHIGMSLRTVRRLVREGLPHTRPRRRDVRIPVPEADAWVMADPERARRLDAPSKAVR